MPTDDSFAIRLLRAQSARKLTQSKLANAMDVKASVICLYQQGKTLPNFENLVKLTKVLGVSADYLLGLQEN
jgi:transcriptional regulator with XRE-family HTH domain